MVFGINIYYQILSSITADDLTELLRELLKKHIFEEQLPDYYKTIIKSRTPFSKFEEEFVLGSPTEGYDKFDLSLLIKVLRNLCGAEVNKCLESLCRLRNRLSHLPSTNINREDFDGWFHELCTLAEFIEDKLEKPKRVRHVFCEIKDKVIENESIENQFCRVEQDLEKISSKGENISNHELELNLYHLRSHIHCIGNVISQNIIRLERLKKFANRVGKTLQPSDDECSFMESSDLSCIPDDRANLTKAPAHGPQQIVRDKTSHFNHSEQPNADFLPHKPNNWPETRTSKFTPNAQNKLQKPQEPDFSQATRIRKLPKDEIHNIGLKPVLNQTSANLPRNFNEKTRSVVVPINCKHNERQFDVSSDSLHNPPISLHPSQTFRTVNKSQINPLVPAQQMKTTAAHQRANTQDNSEKVKSNSEQIGQDKLNKKATAQINKLSLSQKDADTKRNIAEAVEINDDEVNKETRNIKQDQTKIHKTFEKAERKCWQINTGSNLVKPTGQIDSLMGKGDDSNRHPLSNKQTNLSEECRDPMTYKERGKYQNEDNTYCWAKCATAKKSEQRKDRNEHQNKLINTKKISNRTKEKTSPRQQSNTRTSVAIPDESRLSSEVNHEETNRPENNDVLQDMRYHSANAGCLFNINRVTKGTSLYIQRLFCCFNKPSTCYEALNVDFRGDDDMLYDHDEINLERLDYDGDVVILHSDPKFPQDRDLAENMLNEMKNTISGLTGDLQETVQKPGTRVFDVRRLFNYRKIFVLVTRYYKYSPILQYRVDIIRHISLTNKNVNNILIPVLMENITYPCEMLPMHPLEFFQTFEGRGTEHYYPNKLQKIFPHRSLRRSISCF